jgi:hypothetical protein
MAATGPTHHQGSRSLGAYKQAWVHEFILSILMLDPFYMFLLIILLSFSQSASHGGQSLSTFMAYGLARKGKVTSNVTFNPDDPPESYSNPSTDNIDGEMVIHPC